MFIWVPIILNFLHNLLIIHIVPELYKDSFPVFLILSPSKNFISIFYSLLKVLSHTQMHRKFSVASSIKKKDWCHFAYSQEYYIYLTNFCMFFPYLSWYLKGQEGVNHSVRSCSFANRRMQILSFKKCTHF